MIPEPRAPRGEATGTPRRSAQSRIGCVQRREVPRDRGHAELGEQPERPVHAEEVLKRQA